MKWLFLQRTNFMGLNRRVKVNPSRPYPGRREKINFNIYYHTSLSCLKPELIFILIQLSEMRGVGRVKNVLLFKLTHAGMIGTK